jgi:hypothetical protein
MCCITVCIYLETVGEPVEPLQTPHGSRAVVGLSNQNQQPKTVCAASPSECSLRLLVNQVVPCACIGRDIHGREAVRVQSVHPEAAYSYRLARVRSTVPAQHGTACSTHLRRAGTRHRPHQSMHSPRLYMLSAPGRASTHPESIVFGVHTLACEHSV